MMLFCYLQELVSSLESLSPHVTKKTLNGLIELPDVAKSTSTVRTKTTGCTVIIITFCNLGIDRLGY
jgi:hypothetical protein